MRNWSDIVSFVPFNLDCHTIVWSLRYRDNATSPDSYRVKWLFRLQVNSRPTTPSEIQDTELDTKSDSNEVLQFSIFLNGVTRPMEPTGTVYRRRWASTIWRTSTRQCDIARYLGACSNRQADGPSAGRRRRVFGKANGRARDCF